MHDAENAMRAVGQAWFAVMGVIAIVGIAAYTLGSGERREANRRSIRRSSSGSGWMLLSYTLKYGALAFPHVGPGLTWLWIPAFVLAMLSWLIKGLRWLIRRCKRLRPVETTYTRALLGANRRRP